MILYLDSVIRITSFVPNAYFRPCFDPLWSQFQRSPQTPRLFRPPVNQERKINILLLKVSQSTHLTTKNCESDKNPNFLQNIDVSMQLFEKFLFKKDYHDITYRIFSKISHPLLEATIQQRLDRNCKRRNTLIWSRTYLQLGLETNI